MVSLQMSSIFLCLVVTQIYLVSDFFLHTKKILKSQRKSQSGAVEQINIRLLLIKTKDPASIKVVR